MCGRVTVNYPEPQGSLAGRPIPLADIQYRLLFEPSVRVILSFFPREPHSSTFSTVCTTCSIFEL